MPRSIWSGAISFGLLHIPVQLVTAEAPSEIPLRMLDRRDNSPIQFKRVNAETGRDVDWKDVVKAYEVEKGEFVPLEPEDIKRAAPEAAQAIEIERFVERDSVSAMYFDRPYYLTPGKKAEKGYVLLREVLERTGRIGLARVVIRTKEYLCAVMPVGDALVLELLRWPEEIVDAGGLDVPKGRLDEYRISVRELEMAEQLIAAMAGEFEPAAFKDTFHDKLAAVIEAKMKKGGKRSAPAATAKPTATNVVDFMALLKQSIEKSGGGAKRTAPRSRARQAASRKRATTRRKSG